MITIKDLKKEVLEWAQEIGVQPKEIHVKKMSRRWATCSSKGRLTFSYDVLCLPKEARAKVIVHELLHLKYPTHNRMFRLLLSTYLAKKGIEEDQIQL